MPGVYVKDMKMPKDCPMCPMAHWNAFNMISGCEVVPGKKYAIRDPEYANSDTRPDWCPLVNIPPHGDLIDRDALPKGRVEWEDILEAPSVIPADEVQL